ncbi:MAG: hypothetical protein AB2689_28885 [Candidatus Thiodiazotropha taylori]
MELTSLDIHPYLLIYLIGCVLVVVMLPIQMTLFWIIKWVTKENNLNKNLKKLQPPKEEGLLQRFLFVIVMIVIEALLSWINVIVILFKTLKYILSILRESLTQKPEIVKSLRFPLWNNPDMTRESVWAHYTGLRIHAAGEQLDESDLHYSLNEVEGFYPYFDKKEAISQLKHLKVIDNEILSSVQESEDTEFNET